MTAAPEVRALADLAAGTIVATVDICASRERVFRALTSAEVTLWWGHAGSHQTIAWSADLKVGGRWRADVRRADGSTSFVSGIYTLIQRPSRLEFSWIPAWDGSPATTVSYKLEEQDGGTRLTVIHAGFAGLPETCRTGHAQGWARVLRWLRDYVEISAPGSATCAST